MEGPSEKRTSNFKYDTLKRYIDKLKLLHPEDSSFLDNTLSELYRQDKFLLSVKRIFKLLASRYKDVNSLLQVFYIGSLNFQTAKQSSIRKYIHSIIIYLNGLQDIENLGQYNIQINTDDLVSFNVKTTTDQTIERNLITLLNQLKKIFDQNIILLTREKGFKIEDILSRSEKIKNIYIINRRLTSGVNVGGGHRGIIETHGSSIQPVNPFSAEQLGELPNIPLPKRPRPSIPPFIFPLPPQEQEEGKEKEKIKEEEEEEKFYEMEEMELEDIENPELLIEQQIQEEYGFIQETERLGTMEIEKDFLPDGRQDIPMPQNIINPQPPNNIVPPVFGGIAAGNQNNNRRQFLGMSIWKIIVGLSVVAALSASEVFIRYYYNTGEEVEEVRPNFQQEITNEMVNRTGNITASIQQPNDDVHNYIITANDQTLLELENQIQNATISNVPPSAPPVTSVFPPSVAPSISQRINEGDGGDGGDGYGNDDDFYLEEEDNDEYQPKDDKGNPIITGALVGGASELAKQGVKIGAGVAVAYNAPSSLFFLLGAGAVIYLLSSK